MLESIEKLRKQFSGHFSDVYEGDLRHYFELACDEVEGEIAERYTKLPVDADGEPIHVGDMLIVRYQKPPKEVAGFGVLDGEPFVVWYDIGLAKGTKALTMKKGGGGWDRLSSIDAHHVRHDTWERIIADAAATVGSFEELVARCKTLAGEGE